MSDFSQTDTGSEYESALSEQDALEDHPTSSNEDGLEHQPSSSEEDESDYVPYRRPKSNRPLELHRGPVIFEQHHLRADTDIGVGTVVSIGETLELRDGSFLKITCFGNTKKSQSQTFFGHLLRGIEKFQEYLPVTYGDSELVLVCEAKQQDPKPGGYLRSATSKEVLRIRHLVLPISESASDSIPKFEATGTRTDSRPLFCRWMLVAELSNSHVTGRKRSSRSTMRGSQGQPKAFIALSSQEPLVGEIMAVDFPHSQQHYPDDALPKASSNDGLCQLKKHGHSPGKNLRKCKRRCKDARRSKVLAPNTSGNRITKATRCSGRRKSSHDLETSLARMFRTSSSSRTLSEQDMIPQIYTFADAFCGAGGMSIGARDAGLRIEWAFDMDADAVDTYSANQGSCVCARISAQDLLALGPGNEYESSKVDILHLSPPCEGFSMAVRGSPRNGAEDNNCMTYVRGIVEKVKPRIVTFEEVREVLFRHRDFFTAMVHALTSMTYSVRWRVLECADFGVPQKRKRLFLIASCQGEPLPDFPKPTHAHYAYSAALYLQPWNTVQGAIDNLEDSAPNHLLAHGRTERCIEDWAPPHPPNWPWHGTITTGENWPDHYSGKYRCTVREAACLQGFPADYAFCGNLSATMKQVANAVPPPVATAVLEEVKRSLMRTDASRRS